MHMIGLSRVRLSRFLGGFLTTVYTVLASILSPVTRREPLAGGRSPFASFSRTSGSGGGLWCGLRIYSTILRRSLLRPLLYRGTFVSIGLADCWRRMRYFMANNCYAYDVSDHQTNRPRNGKEWSTRRPELLKGLLYHFHINFNIGSYTAIMSVGINLDSGNISHVAVLVE